MKINCVSNCTPTAFNGRFTGFLSKLKSKFSPKSEVIVPEVVDTFSRTQYGVTETGRFLKDGQVMKIVTYPTWWPHTDFVFSKNMCKKVDKDIAGFRIQIPNSYLAKHPEATTEEGSVEFAKMVRHLANDVFHSDNAAKKDIAIKKFAEMLGVKEPYTVKINGQL